MQTRLDSNRTVNVAKQIFLQPLAISINLLLIISQFVRSAKYFMLIVQRFDLKGIVYLINKEG